MRPIHSVCDRARTYASLQLDGELSQLEEAMLTAHLLSCDACRAYHAEITAVTRELRAAQPVRLERPVALPHRRRVSFGAVQAAAAAGVALVAVGLSGVFDANRSDRTSSTAFAASKRPAYLQSAEYELRLLERYSGVSLTDGDEIVF